MAKKLTEKQLQAIELISTYRKPKLTYREVADKVGVSEQTLRRWRQDNEFYVELKEEIVRRTVLDLPDVYHSMVDEAINKRNAAMTKLLLQSHSMLTDKTKIETFEVPRPEIDVDELKAMTERFKSGTDTSDEPRENVQLTLQIPPKL
ncbi:helix-turn-helix domain-containing protein [Paenalkalicoccus suaedae]|uniref:Helix-turn-helix domain-containing protein n=1 Tax=Paenalkalicoccus suaedae TaxID=2592382 RepID=A0A859FFR3_9BACI|nr:phBC6A51 family helix-turn-helix protein [Paenalkalicoccus suaedae]QKS71947.1 helix-turn-helix domain-containing protein [Paenalkalicoccus suaedae]